MEIGYLLDTEQQSSSTMFVLFCFSFSPSFHSFFFLSTFPNILLLLFSHKAKLKELCRQDPYNHYLDSTINILLYLLYYILICSSLCPSINPFYCLCWAVNFFSFLTWAQWLGVCKLTDSRQISRRKDKLYLHMHVGVW